MGITSSKEIGTIQEEHKQKMDEETRKRQSEEDQKKKKIEEEREAEIEEEKNRINEELKVEADDNLRHMEKHTKSYNETKKECQKQLEELDAQLRENMLKQVNEHKKNGLDKVTDKKKELKEEKDMLILKKELLLHETNRLTEERQKERNERSEMVKEYGEQEKQQITIHHENMMRINEEKNKAVINGEKEQTRMVVENREFQNDIRQRHLELDQVKMSHAQELLFIMNSDQHFKDFRQNCKQKIGGFARFKEFFDAEKKDVNTTRDDIDQGVELSSPPDLSNANRALSDFQREMMKFDLEGASENDQTKFSKLRGIVLSQLEELKSAITKIESKIEAYEKQHPNGIRQSTSQLNQDDSRASSDIDDFDNCSGISTPPPSVRSFKSNQKVNDLRKFSIAKYCKKATALIQQLNAEMLEFNVPSSTKFEDTLAIQFKNLSVSQSQIVGQITNGLIPRTSSTVGGITDDTKSSKPSIQNSEES